MQRPSIALAVLGICGSVIVYAVDMDLSELSIEELTQVRVYAASRFSQTLADAPSGVTIVTAENIRDHGWRSLGEILNSIRGVYITTDRTHTYAGMRGFGRPGDYNSRLLILVDGIRINDGLFSDGFLGNELPLSVDMIERVEFVPGPGSAVYGNNAFLGVVSVTTRSPQAVGREVVLETGSHGHFAGRASVGETSENGSWLLSTDGLRQSGEDLYIGQYIPHKNGGIPVTGGLIQNKDGESLENILLKVQQGPVTLTLLHGERHKEVPAPIYGSIFADPRTFFDSIDTLADLRFNDQMGSWNLTARVYHGELQINSTYPFPGIFPQDNLESNWQGGEIHAETTGMTGHHWVFGAEYQHDRRNHYENSAFGINVNLAKESYGLYLQDEFALDDRFRFNGGLRYDSYSNFGGILNPRAALIYSADQATTWKLLYGSAYRAPSDLERFYNIGTSDSLSDLHPEKIRTWEVLWERMIGPHQRHVASLFYYQAEDLIELVQVAVPFTHYVERNLRSAQATGLEYGIETTSSDGWQGRASITWQYAKDSDTGEWLTNSPRLLGKVDFSVPVAGWRLGSELLAIGPRRQVPVSATAPPGRTAATAVVNLVVHGEALAPGLEWRAGIYNLLDTEYADPTFKQTYAENGIPELVQPGRNVALQAVYRWK